MASQPTPDELEDVLLSVRYGDLDDIQTFVSTYGTSSLASIADEHLNTPLHMAAANGHTEIINFLLPLLPPSAAGASNDAGSTPLHWAALNKHLESAQALINYAPGPGPTLVNVKNKAGRSALGEAENAGWEDGARWLVSVMDLGDSPQATEGLPDVGEQEEGKDAEDGGDVKFEAKTGKVGGPVTVEITDADGRMASMTLDELRASTKE